MLNIRNFCIISHIDHGKSTLADRLLELTGTVEQRKMRAQFLDTMDLERERGITIKLQPVQLNYRNYLLNLIDTPGHVDFSYEVSRSLAAVEGALLLVDASQGIQAQTLANLHLAQEQKLTIIPVINKIDLDQARVKETSQEISQLLSVDEKEIIKISAKAGTNIEQILTAIVEKIPSPDGRPEKPLRALIFDSHYDAYQGVIAHLRLFDGQLKNGQSVKMLATDSEAEVREIGFFKPNPTQVDTLSAGQIGYLATGLKNVSQCRVGDTISHAQSAVSPLAGYQEPIAMLLASFYPSRADDYDLLKDSLAKLKLNDASLEYRPESSVGLGRGFRCGFLGLLHLEIVSERLRREYGLNLIISSPAVDYRSGQEPWAELEIICPLDYLGPVTKLLEKTRGHYQETEYLTSQRILVRYQVPLAEIIIDFYDNLKKTTSGYASMSYQLIDYRPADLVQLDILVAGEKVEAFSQLVHKKKAYFQGRALVDKLKELIPRHQFAISLQALVDNKIIARQNISPLKKDVTAGLYGGDYTRKRKLLEKQKKGKKKMKQRGRVNIPEEVFLKILRR